MGGDNKKQHTGICCQVKMKFIVETIRAEICYTNIYLPKDLLNKSNKAIDSVEYVVNIRTEIEHKDIK